MKKLFKILCGVTVIAAVTAFSSCTKSEIPREPQTQIEQAVAAAPVVGGYVTVFCPDRPHIRVNVNSQGMETGNDPNYGGFNVNVGIGESAYAPDVRVDQIYFSFDAGTLPSNHSYYLEGDLELIQDNRNGTGYVRFKYTTDANGNIYAPNGQLGGAITLIAR